MIQLDVPNNTSVFIYNEYITVAKNNPTTINFIEDDLSCPSVLSPPNLTIGSSLINQTLLSVTSNLDCSPDPNITNTRDFFYEVIDSKVIYARNDKSNNLTFIDVSREETYTHIHNIPVDNTTWIQNPALQSNRGRVFVEKYNEDNTSWEVVGSMPLSGSFTYYSPLDKENSYNCRFRSKYLIRERQNCGGTSPLIFETYGEEFTVDIRYYEENNLQISQINSNDEKKHHICLTDTQNFLSVEVDTSFEALFTSYNINYVYNYLDSSVDQLPLSLEYDEIDRKLYGSITDTLPVVPRTTTTVEFIGCQNQFINGILTVNTNCQQQASTQGGDFDCNDFSSDFFTNCSESANPTTTSETLEIVIEGVRPFIDEVVQEDCTYCLELIDKTDVQNSCLKGKVYYQYRNSLEEEWVDFIPPNTKEVYPLNTFLHCFCGDGVVYLRNKYKYEHTSKCGKKTFTLFETDWYDYDFEVKEFKPEIHSTVINNDACCLTLDFTSEENQFINIVPEYIHVNDYSCNDITPRLQNTLKYNLELYNQEDNIWELVDNVTFNIDFNDYSIENPKITDSTVLDKYKYQLDKTSLVQGGYRVRQELQNCCYETEEVVYLNLCDSLTIKRQCQTIDEDCDCYKYVINNYSPTDVYSIEIYNVALETVVDTLTVIENTEMEYTFPEDGIFTFTIKNESIASESIGKYSNPYIIPVFVFCGVDKCYTEIIKDILCSYNPDCNCENEDLVKDRFRLNKIMALYQTFMKLIEKDFYLMVRYNAFDLEDRIKSYQGIQRVYDQLKKFCEPCENGIKTNCCG